jgi:hypothetical protein
MKSELKSKIAEAYTKEVLSSELFPKSVYAFCQKHNFQEKEFYEGFASLEAVKNYIWVAFHKNCKKVLKKNKSYSSYDSKEKFLAYLFSYFEVLTLNRSYVLYVLSTGHSLERLQNLRQLKDFRTHYLNFVKDILLSTENDSKLKEFNDKLFSEGTWIQFLVLLKFWIEDESPKFEKTDIAIEKSVQAVFDLLQSNPLEKWIDLGKFMVKEGFKL